MLFIWLAGHFEAGLPYISFQIKFFSFLVALASEFFFDKMIVTDNIY